MRRLIGVPQQAVRQLMSDSVRFQGPVPHHNPLAICLPKNCLRATGNQLAVHSDLKWHSCEQCGACCVRVLPGLCLRCRQRLLQQLLRFARVGVVFRVAPAQTARGAGLLSRTCTQHMRGNTQQQQRACRHAGMHASCGMGANTNSLREGQART